LEGLIHWAVQSFGDKVVVVVPMPAEATMEYVKVLDDVPDEAETTLKPIP
jgi:hypothetical protein